ncbi:hypothetical protein EST38_g5175 [Candolleomyces aberdarensis]|uniref:Uncharacterized protein n=1 Tax=Candolleomyces aberdarensis TaxID=2316362 RepID=A0A4Q2DMV8_9AGAR|nr:hypothetical protein EST38_g5175 [Candolleomyces aberdarensis]
MIIFRVTTGRSFTKSLSVKDGIVTNPIQFARRTAESSFIQTTLNRALSQNHDSDTEQGLNSSVGELPSQTQKSIIHVVREKRNDGGDLEKLG